MGSPSSTTRTIPVAPARRLTGRARAAQLAAYARRVEALLGEHLGDRSDPVLVAGQIRRLAAVTARPGLADRSGARLAVNLELAPVAEIAERVAAEVGTMIAVHVGGARSPRSATRWARDAGWRVWTPHGRSRTRVGSVCSWPNAASRWR